MSMHLFELDGTTVEMVEISIKNFVLINQSAILFSKFVC